MTDTRNSYNYGTLVIGSVARMRMFEFIQDSVDHRGQAPAGVRLRAGRQRSFPNANTFQVPILQCADEVWLTDQN